MLLLSNMAFFAILSSFFTHKYCRLIFCFAKPLTIKCSVKILRLRVANLRLIFSILSWNCDWIFSFILNPVLYQGFQLEARNRQIWPPTSYIKFHSSCYCLHVINIYYSIWCQNAGNGISGLLDSKIFWGSLPTSKVIETPAVFSINQLRTSGDIHQ